MKAKSHKNIIKVETEERGDPSDPGSSHYFYALGPPFDYPGIDPREIVHP